MKLTSPGLEYFRANSDGEAEAIAMKAINDMR